METEKLIFAKIENSYTAIVRAENVPHLLCPQHVFLMRVHILF